MAEAFVNVSELAKQGHVSASSAGTNPAGVVSAIVVSAMKELGISMEGHYSKGLTDEMMKEASIIVATCDEVCVAIPKEIEEKKKLIKWQISDPVRDIDHIRSIRDEIKEKVEELLKALES